MGWEINWENDGKWNLDYCNFVNIGNFLFIYRNSRLRKESI